MSYAHLLVQVRVVRPLGEDDQLPGPFQNSILDPEAVAADGEGRARLVVATPPAHHQRKLPRNLDLCGPWSSF